MMGFYQRLFLETLLSLLGVYLYMQLMSKLNIYNLIKIKIVMKVLKISIYGLNI